MTSGTSKVTEPVDAVLTCAERDRHATRLGQICAGCDERIPGHGYYTPSEYARYFAPPAVETPQYVDPETAGYRADNGLRWQEYIALDAARVALVFRLEAVKQGRYRIRGSSRYVEQSGNVVEDSTASQRGAQADATIGELEAQLREAERIEAEHMRETIKRDNIHAGRRRAAVMAESFPPPAPGLLERVGAALRGEGA